MGKTPMYLTPIETILTIGTIALGTMCTRFLPFILFPDKKKTPPYITFLGKVLPYAVISFLVVYCVKDISILEKPFAIPELVSMLFILVLHVWKRNSLLSIGGGTILYMLLIQYL